jgi:hypothetical protein
MVSNTTTRTRREYAHGVSNCVVVVAWFAAIALSWCYVAGYEFSVNRALPNRIVSRWPHDTTLVRHEGQPTLVLFVHPKCPCTRATVSELFQLYASLEENPGRAPNLIVVATVPTSSDESWQNTATVEQATRLINSQLFVDAGGVEAARFGATTSGFVMLFDGAGTRRFAGGITFSRGHEGPSTGRDALTSILRNEPCNVDQTPAFGCRLCLPKQPRDGEIAKQASEDRSTT